MFAKCDSTSGFLFRYALIAEMQFVSLVEQPLQADPPTHVRAVLPRPDVVILRSNWVAYKTVWMDNREKSLNDGARYINLTVPAVTPFR